MRKPTLLRHLDTTWSHPYGAAPFGVLYADGGDGDGSDSTGDDGGDTGGTGDTETGAGGGEPDTGGDGAAKDTDTGAGKDTGGEDLAAKVARLEKQLKGANADAAKARTDAKKKAADEARNSIVQELGKALGLIKDDDKDTAPDPAKLTAEITRATAAHRETVVELAVFKRAGRGGADPDALTDSRAFLSKLKDLDPTADDFTEKLDKAIADAVKDNPKLKAGGTTAAAAAVADFTGGDGQPDKATPADDIDKIRAERRKRRAG
jgi:hypothetical protein